MSFEVVAPHLFQACLVQFTTTIFILNTPFELIRAFLTYHIF